MGGGSDIDETQPGVATASVLEKPFVPERLVATVQEVIEGWTTATTERPSKEEPAERHDTIVQPRVDLDDEFPDTEKTDIFPFAHLLEYGRTSPPIRSRGRRPRCAGRSPCREITNVFGARGRHATSAFAVGLSSRLRCCARFRGRTEHWPAPRW